MVVVEPRVITPGVVGAQGMPIVDLAQERTVTLVRLSPELSPSYDREFHLEISRKLVCTYKAELHRTLGHETKPV